MHNLTHSPDPVELLLLAKPDTRPLAVQTSAGPRYAELETQARCQLAALTPWKGEKKDECHSL